MGYLRFGWHYIIGVTRVDYYILRECNNMNSKIKKYILKPILILLGIAILVFYIGFQRFKIPAGSMIPTLLVGDHILVNKYNYRINNTHLGDVKRGDVVVLEYPNIENDPSKNGIYYIKRIVGLPGDSIDVEGRTLIINGQEVPLEFIGTFKDERNGERFDEYSENLSGNEHRVIFRKGRDSTNKGSFLPVSEVPEGYVFVMGDNRDNSQDSRFWGFVPLENITGKAILVHWSWDFDSPDAVSKVRWNRILLNIN